jgi:hypothetical protein
MVFLNIQHVVNGLMNIQHVFLFTNGLLEHLVLHS